MPAPTNTPSRINLHARLAKLLLAITVQYSWSQGLFCRTVDQHSRDLHIPICVIMMFCHDQGRCTSQRAFLHDWDAFVSTSLFPPAWKALQGDLQAFVLLSYFSVESIAPKLSLIVDKFACIHHVLVGVNQGI
jgi:hypothetical protein